jgi:Fic family protein
MGKVAFGKEWNGKMIAESAVIVHELLQKHESLTIQEMTKITGISYARIQTATRTLENKGIMLCENNCRIALMEKAWQGIDV